MRFNIRSELNSPKIKNVIYNFKISYVSMVSNMMAKRNTASILTSNLLQLDEYIGLHTSKEIYRFYNNDHAYYIIMYSDLSFLLSEHSAKEIV